MVFLRAVGGVWTCLGFVCTQHVVRELLMPVQTLWQAPSSLEVTLLGSLNGDIKTKKILLGALLGTASTVCFVSSLSVSSHRRGIGLGDLSRSLPTQTVLLFCRSCRLPCWAFCLCWGSLGCQKVIKAGGSPLSTGSLPINMWGAGEGTRNREECGRSGTGGLWGFYWQIPVF